MKKLLLWLLVVAITLLTGLFLYQRAINAPNFSEQVVVFTIGSGESSSQIIDRLATASLIKQPLLARFYFWRIGASGRLRAGEYNLAPHSSLVKLTKKLLSGQIEKITKKVLFKEGLTITTMDDELKAAGVITDNSFVKLARTKIKDLPAELKAYAFLVDAPVNADLEGFLFPDTYTFYVADSASNVVKKMLDNFDRQFSADLRNRLAAQHKTFFEVVTLASVVQKEVRSTADMRTVAGIFYNRLAQGQRLQSCATLAYILGVNKEQYDQEDVATVSPYNTYLHAGLPPGPIANPGLQALEATLDPTKTDYLFFLSRFDNGQTVFAKTLDEHNLNKAKYLP